MEQLKVLLSSWDEDFQFQNFFYSDNSLYRFLYSLDNQTKIEAPEASRKLIMAFGIEQLLNFLASCYKDWGKYEQAQAQYQQSRERYEQLGKQKDVADQWY